MSLSSTQELISLDSIREFILLALTQPCIPMKVQIGILIRVVAIDSRRHYNYPTDFALCSVFFSYKLCEKDLFFHLFLLLSFSSLISLPFLFSLNHFWQRFFHLITNHERSHHTPDELPWAMSWRWIDHLSWGDPVNLLGHPSLSSQFCIYHSELTAWSITEPTGLSLRA